MTARALLQPQVQKERLDFGSKVKARGIRLPPCLPSVDLNCAGNDLFPNSKRETFHINVTQLEAVANTKNRQKIKCFCNLKQHITFATISQV